MSESGRPVMMELDDVSHSYHVGKKNFDKGKHHILNQVSMRLYEGETLGIMGRNGVGKTTMLRLMGGILAPTHGKVYIQPGKSVSLLTLGLGFRGELSGRDNALLSAMLQGATRKQAESYLDDIMEFSELEDSFFEPVKNYSAGMRARLAFTTALMTHVDVLLIDEILSVGDAHFRGKAQVAMSTRISGNQTVVFVSHMADQIKDVCNRVIWLDKGRIIMEGSAEEVTQAYGNFINEGQKAGAMQQQKQKQQA